jgi:hypothetical protein
MTIQEALKLAKKRKKKIRSDRTQMSKQNEDTIVHWLLKVESHPLAKVNLLTEILIATDWELE